MLVVIMDMVLGLWMQKQPITISTKKDATLLLERRWVVVIIVENFHRPRLSLLLPFLVVTTVKNTSSSQ